MIWQNLLQFHDTLAYPDSVDSPGVAVLDTSLILSCGGIYGTSGSYTTKCYKMNIWTRDAWTPMDDLEVGASGIAMEQLADSNVWISME